MNTKLRYFFDIGKYYCCVNFVTYVYISLIYSCFNEYFNFSI